MPAAEHSKWIEDRDIEDANAARYLLRICGVMLGGAGLAMARA